MKYAETYFFVGTIASVFTVAAGAVLLFVNIVLPALRRRLMMKRQKPIEGADIINPIDDGHYAVQPPSAIIPPMEKLLIGQFWNTTENRFIGSAPFVYNQHGIYMMKDKYSSMWKCPENYRLVQWEGILLFEHQANEYAMAAD